MFKNLSVLFLSSIICFTPVAFAKSQFYLKTLETFSKASSIKADDKELNFKLNHESTLSPAIGIGIGYYIDNITRIDMTFEHLKFDFNNQSAPFECDNGDCLTTGTKSIKRTTSGKSLMFNLFADLIEKNSFKFFLGAGIGVVQIKEKMTHSLSGISETCDEKYTFPLITEQYTSKAMNKFAYSLMAGTSIKLNPELNIELIYSWKNFGKVKYPNNSVKNLYEGHHFSIGIRFDL